MINIFFPTLVLLISLGAPRATLALDSGDLKPMSMSSGEKPKELEGVGITERLGEAIDLNLKVRDEEGNLVELKSFFNGQPVVISFIYYACPGLCNFHLNGVIDTLKTMKWSVGNEFKLLAISFDSKEGAELAAKKKQTYLTLYGRGGAENGLRFLTADAPTIAQITQQTGFQYKWDDSAKEWAHASAAIIMTPNGVISRYLHGIQFEASTFEMALREATQGKIGTVVDKMIWFCYHYDPKTSKYTLAAFRLMQLGGGLMIIILAALLLPNWWKSRRKQASA